MNMSLVLCLSACLLVLSVTAAPIIIKENDRSAVIMGQEGGGSGVPIVISERMSLKELFMQLLMALFNPFMAG